MPHARKAGAEQTNPSPLCGTDTAAGHRSRRSSSLSSQRPTANARPHSGRRHCLTNHHKNALGGPCPGGPGTPKYSHRHRARWYRRAGAHADTNTNADTKAHANPSPNPSSDAHAKTHPTADTRAHTHPTPHPDSGPQAHGPDA